MDYTNDYTSSLVTKVVENGKRFIENPENKNLQTRATLPTRTYYFYYDSLNRLTREVKHLYGNILKANDGTLTYNPRNLV